MKISPQHLDLTGFQREVRAAAAYRFARLNSIPRLHDCSNPTSFLSRWNEVSMFLLLVQWMGLRHTIHETTEPTRNLVGVISCKFADRVLFPFVMTLDLQGIRRYKVKDNHRVKEC